MSNAQKLSQTKGTNTLVPVSQGGTGAATLSGLVKGNGTSAMTAATSGTDYCPPIGSISTIVKGNGTGTLTSATAETDYVTPSGSGILSNKTLTNPTITNYTETLYTPAAGSSFTVSLSNGTIQQFTTNANATITLPTSVAGKSYVIIVNYGGAHTLTWAGGSTLKWAGGTTPSATSTSGKYDVFSFFCDGTNTYGNTIGLNY